MRLFDSFEDEYLKQIKTYAKLAIMRRITNYNSLIFRTNNYNFANKHDSIKKYIKKFVMYYVDYYIKYINLDKFDD